MSDNRIRTLNLKTEDFRQKKDYIMKNISYFKLQAKNLFRDFKSDFMKNEATYICAPKFFDVNVIISDFEVEADDFTLMKAQHIIAKISGFNSWDELIKAPESLLEQGKEVLEASGVKLRKKIIYKIDLSSFEKIDEGRAGDYLLKCPRLKELEEIIAMKPNCYFLSCSNLDINKLSDDMTHIYVNVIPKSSSIRVMVPGEKWPDYYAVSVKNIF